METPPNVLEIFLQPGDFFFGDHETRLRTILGSCVSVTFWHPRKLLGGMCHIMLPTRSGKDAVALDPSGKYADEAIALLLDEIKKAGTTAIEYQVKVFGGGDMFAHRQTTHKATVGQKNIQMVKDLLDKHHFTTEAEHLGGEGHRYIIFDIWSGNVWVKHHALSQPMKGLVGA